MKRGGVVGGEDAAMMGERTVMLESLFYEFSLERHVPSDHPNSHIDDLLPWTYGQVHDLKAVA